jgi:hypothetical protein
MPEIIGNREGGIGRPVHAIALLCPKGVIKGKIHKRVR